MKRFVFAVITAVALFTPTLVLAQDSAPGAVPPEVKVGVTDIRSVLLDAFIKYLVPIIFTGLSGLIGWALLALRKKLEAEADHSQLAAAAARATAVIDSVTNDLEATLKPVLLEAVKDGKIDGAEQKQMRDVALARVKELLGKEGLQDLVNVLGIEGGAIDKLLQGLIEKSVSKIGSSTPAVPSPP